jgi:N-acetylneuraminate synthase
VTNHPLLERMAHTGRPVLLSSGMSTWAELDAAVAVVQPHAPLALFQCTTSYPCPAEKTGLNVLAQLRERFGVPVGLSDHSATVFAGLAAASLGANLVEVHVCFSRGQFGPDTGSSLEPAELAELVRGISWIEKALAHPVNKDVEAAEHADVKRIFGKSIVAAHDLPAGTVLGASVLALKKPGTGLPAHRWSSLLGRTLKKPVARDACLAEDDLD